MKSFVLSAAGLVTVLSIAAASMGGCGDSGGLGGSGGATSATSTASATSSTKATTAVSTSTGMADCVEITPAQFQRLAYDASYAQFDYTVGMLGGAAKDYGDIEFYNEAMPTGSIDLASMENANYQTCSQCVLVFQDDDGVQPGKFFFQSSGKLELGTTTLPAITGSLSDVTLVEVTIDLNDLTSTPVPGGACLHIASAPFAFEAVPVAWTCDPNDYGDKLQCSCADCGVDDVDCTDSTLPILDCQTGQTCDMGACAGIPTGWTCLAANFGGGVGNGCDCDCGGVDPDCMLPGEALAGCTNASDICNIHGACVPLTWTCNVDYLNDGGCDCGCGLLDSDCPNAMKASCEFCGDLGSCDEGVDCMDAASKIDTTNNAVCN